MIVLMVLLYSVTVYFRVLMGWQNVRDYTANLVKDCMADRECSEQNWGMLGQQKQGSSFLILISNTVYYFVYFFKLKSIC